MTALLADVAPPPQIGLDRPTFVAPMVMACALSVALTALLIRASKHLGLIDQPSDRKVHTRPTPRSGGLAIFAAVAVTATCFSEWFFWYLGRELAWILCSPAIVLVGLADDLMSLAWPSRLVTQSALAALAVYGSLSGSAWPVLIVAAFWVVAMTNAFNMLDNMDALSAGAALIACGAFAIGYTVLGPTRYGQLVPLPWMVLAGALLGFLCFNRPPARIFMGDSGSTFLGFVLGVSGVLLATRESVPPWGWAASVSICAVPCYDMTSVIFLRLKQGRSPFHADKQHLSHRLVERGLSKPKAVGVISLMSVLSGAMGLAILEAKTAEAAALAGGALAAWWIGFALVERSWRHRRTTGTSPQQATCYIIPENPSPKESSHEPPT